MSGAQREMRSDELVEAMENLHQYPRLIAERAYAEGLAAGTLAPTPPDALDVIAAVRKAFDSGARLKHKADDPTSSYDPLARETVVLAALRAALEDADRE